MSSIPTSYLPHLGRLIHRFLDRMGGRFAFDRGGAGQENGPGRIGTGVFGSGPGMRSGCFAMGIRASGAAGFGRQLLNTMTPQTARLFACVIALAHVLPSNAGETAGRPNIVLILADDLRRPPRFLGMPFGTPTAGRRESECRGIYELSGGRLRVCMSRPGGTSPRPSRPGPASSSTCTTNSPPVC
jgi:uncharacterized protein (TIGR03067 family)